MSGIAYAPPAKAGKPSDETGTAKCRSRRPTKEVQTYFSGKLFMLRLSAVLCQLSLVIKAKTANVAPPFLVLHHADMFLAVQC